MPALVDTDEALHRLLLTFDAERGPELTEAALEFEEPYDASIGHVLTCPELEGL